MQNRRRVESNGPWPLLPYWSGCARHARNHARGSLSRVSSQLTGGVRAYAKRRPGAGGMCSSLHSCMLSLLVLLLSLLLAAAAGPPAHWRCSALALRAKVAAAAANASGVGCVGESGWARLAPAGSTGSRAPDSGRSGSAPAAPAEASSSVSIGEAPAGGAKRDGRGAAAASGHVAARLSRQTVTAPELCHQLRGIWDAHDSQAAFAPYAALSAAAVALRPCQQAANGRSSRARRAGSTAD